MLFSKIIVLLGFTAFSGIAFANPPSREVRLHLTHSESVSHLYNPAFLNANKPLHLDLTKIFQPHVMPETPEAAIEESVLVYASLINAMVDGLNAATLGIARDQSRTFDVVGAPAQELLRQLQAVADRDATSAVSVGLNFTQIRVLKVGHIQVGSDQFLQALGIRGLDCTNLELPMPNPHCVFYRE